MPLNIDWQQILLHLFNFILLTMGLYVLIYEPVRKFMEAREEHYKEMDLEANKKYDEAQKLLEDHSKKLADVDNEIRIYREKQMSETQKRIHDQLENAKEKEHQIIEEAHKKAQVEKEKIINEARNEIKGIALEATKKIVCDPNKDVFDDFLEHVSDGK